MIQLILVTRIAYSKNLTATKFSQLEEIARHLGKVRHEVWDRWGSVAGYAADPRKIRDTFMAQERDFGLPARVWKETLRDTLDDIKARRESDFKAVAQMVYRKLGAKEGKEKCRALRDGSWQKDSLLHRLVRKDIPRGRTWVDHQIVLDCQSYTHFTHGGKGWIAVQSLNKGKRIAVPLDSVRPVTGTLRLILREGRVEVHHQIELEQRESTKTAGEVGVDKGYTEVFVDSSGQHHGVGLGALLSAESDYLKVKNASRSKLRAISEAKPHKALSITRNNLGRRKANRRKSQHVSRVRNEVFQATHAVVKDASFIVHENLSVPIKARRQRGRDTNRRLSGWVKGLIQEAIEAVSRRYGVPTHWVNPAYTSQMCSECGLLGERKGDVFYCAHHGCGVVMQADHNAALNVLARLRDPEIRLWTSAPKVKSILLERQECLRLRLSNLDSSCLPSGVLSTESESPSLCTFA